MKKLLAIVLTLAMLLCFAGCGAKDDGKLIMATNAAFPPYEYVENGEYVGIDIEIAELIAKELGQELEIKDVEFGSILGGVQSGKFDIGMAGMTVTDTRKKSVNFSDTYATGIQSVIVKEDAPYASYEDFYTGFDAEGNPAGVKEGIKIGVQQDTTGDIYCSSAPAEWGFGEENVVRYKTGADAVQALITGKVTAVIIDNEPAKAFVAANKGLKIQETSFTEEDYAIAINKEDTELLEDVNAALAKLTK
jgi:polar amino acid transport system substrate-binding protein